MLESTFAPATLEAQSSVKDEIAEIQDLLRKQTQRLSELAAKRLNEPGD